MPVIAWTTALASQIDRAGVTIEVAEPVKIRPLSISQPRTPEFAMGLGLTEDEVKAWRDAIERNAMKELRKIMLTDDQIKFMVDRFLGWKLPSDFSPDCGIVYTKSGPEYHGPVGTSLFTATQAEAMVRHMLNQ